MKSKYTTIKALLIARVIELISSQFKISIKESRDLFYKSETIKLLEDDETGLYGDSALYIFSIYEQEIKKNKLSK